eukprot:GFYU01025583.1.p1 GENE.GFYU01025583.1~~GFYU01025583.1.p1  ORF type:complete len:227 (-),score=64.50 GFYU01025583.1:109-789(-)
MATVETVRTAIAAGADTIETHLQLAELLWQKKEHEDALKEYQTCLDMARKEGDTEKEGMILVGRGYALMSSGAVLNLPLAIESFEAARVLAVAAGEDSEPQVKFIDKMLEDARAGGVCNDTALPTGCAGGGENVLGLNEMEQAIVDIIAVQGMLPWEETARQVSEKLPGQVVNASEVEKTWLEIAPKVKDRLKDNPTMACGHTCNSCPTKDACHLHENLADIEDMY